MGRFHNPIDICNRALQHCGAERIDPTLGFAEDSKRAAECEAVYDKLRRAELRRNNWRFAIRRTVLRPINTSIIQGPGFPTPIGPQTPTMFLAPALWSSSVTYFPGAIVQDETGMVWINKVPDNKGNDPLNSSVWEQYFGPLTVQPFNPQDSYFAGELVYNTIGDGVFRTYLSMQNGNTDVPTVPTPWGSTNFYFADQIVIFYPAWSSGTTYAAGVGVSYLGSYYVSLVGGNLNHTPSTDTARWAPIASINEWDSTVSYALGNSVDYGGIQYVSIVSPNLNLIPLSNPSSWAPITGGTLYLSKIDANMNNEPDLSPLLWQASTTYAAGNTVSGSDGINYTSVGNGNIGNDPTTDGGTNWTSTGVLTPWTSSFVGGSSATRYLPLTAALSDSAIFYPVGTGPSTQAGTRNVFRLPANYLKKAPQDPRAGSTSFLGAPGALPYDDWELEGNYVVSNDNGPIMFRFVADFVDVTQMDDMFCEGLGYRIALAVCEPLTQSTQKKQAIASEYQKFMGEARLINAIETGPEEPALDDYLACRI